MAATKKPTSKARPKTGAKRNASIEELMRKGLIVMGDDESLNIVKMSTGIPMVDEILGGGLPRDRVTLIVGLESAGKTLMCQLASAEFQREGLTVALIDCEMAYDRDWWRSTGVDTETLIVSRPAGGEAAVDVAVALIGNVDLLILDSGAALVPLKEQERAADENQGIGAVARVHKKLFDHIIGLLPGSGTCFLMTNQLRADIGNPRPGSYTYPGGQAQKFWASVIMRIRNAGNKDDGRDVGIQVVKNKVGRPGGNVILPFKFDGTFDEISLVLMDAIDRGVVRHAGAYYRFDEALLTYAVEEPIKVVAGTDMVQVMGRDNLRVVFTEDPEAFARLKVATYAIKGADEREPDLIDVEA